MNTPLILDLDGSVLPLTEGEIRIPLKNWQETIRYGCTFSQYREFEQYLNSLMPKNYGCVFTGSGDFHHLTLFLLQRIIAKRSNTSFDLIVTDNHPDNMRYPFGLHCGSWVSHAAKLEQVSHIHVIGITSEDIGLSHAWENALSPFLQKKLTYWSIGSTASWLRFLGRGKYNKSYDDAESLLEDFLCVLRQSEQVYLSVDKDVLSPDTARTNWDQGVFTLSDLVRLAKECQAKLIGADITGDISAYTFKNRGKQLLSFLDGQKKIRTEDLLLWQQDQREVNTRLLSLLAEENL